MEILRHMNRRTSSRVDVNGIQNPSISFETNTCSSHLSDLSLSCLHKGKKQKTLLQYTWSRPLFLNVGLCLSPEEDERLSWRPLTFTPFKSSFLFLIPWNWISNREGRVHTYIRTCIYVIYAYGYNYIDMSLT